MCERTRPPGTDTGSVIGVAAAAERESGLVSSTLASPNVKAMELIWLSTSSCTIQVSVDPMPYWVKLPPTSFRCSRRAY